LICSANLSLSLNRFFTAKDKPSRMAMPQTPALVHAAKPAKPANIMPESDIPKFTENAPKSTTGGRTDAQQTSLPAPPPAIIGKSGKNREKTLHDTRVIHVMMGGEIKRISINGRILVFEDHPQIGPVLLRAGDEPAKIQSKIFLHAASMWYQQGKRMENGLCRWDHEPQPIVKRVGNKNFITGWSQPVKGQ